MNNSISIFVHSLGLIRGLTRSKFVQSVAMLSGGQVLAVAVPLLAAPILGRLYLPSDYGVLGAYLAVSSVLAIVGNWQYSQGIIVEKRENNALVLLQLCYVTSLLTALVSLAIGVGIVSYSTNALLGHRLWFLLLPLSTFFAGVNGSRIALLNRYKRYGKMATVQVTSSTATACLSIALGLSGFGYNGLLMAHFVGQVLVFGIYWRLTSQLPQLAGFSTPSRLLAMARKHRDFALFTTPGGFVGSVATQLPIYALGFMGATTTIGLFSRARQLLEMPITLIGSSISQVFRQQAAAEYARVGNCKGIFLKTLFALSGIGLLPTIFLTIFAPQIFAWFLGPNWREAGEIARVLSPMLYLRLMCSPLSSVYMIAGAQKEDFGLSIATLALVAVAVGLPFVNRRDSIDTIFGFSTAYSIVYMVYLLRSYKLSLARPLSS